MNWEVKSVVNGRELNQPTGELIICDSYIIDVDVDDVLKYVCI